jgi:hypothetical protein
MADSVDKARIRSIDYSAGSGSVGTAGAGAASLGSGFAEAEGLAASFLGAADAVGEAGADASKGASSVVWSALIISSLMVPSRLSISFILVWLTFLSPAVSPEHALKIGRSNRLARINGRMDKLSRSRIL